MRVRTVDPDCGYVPFSGRPHTEVCDRTAHVLLALAVAACIDPPLYRAIAGDHELCFLVPCAYCKHHR